MQKRRLKNKGSSEKEMQMLEQDIEQLRNDFTNLQRKITKEIHSIKNNVYA